MHDSSFLAMLLQFIQESLPTPSKIRTKAFKQSIWSQQRLEEVFCTVHPTNTRALHNCFGYIGLIASKNETNGWFSLHQFLSRSSQMYSNNPWGTYWYHEGPPMVFVCIHSINTLLTWMIFWAILLWLKWYI